MHGDFYAVYHNRADGRFIVGMFKYQQDAQSYISFSFDNPEDAEIESVHCEYIKA